MELCVTPSLEVLLCPPPDRVSLGQHRHVPPNLQQGGERRLLAGEVTQRHPPRWDSF